MALSVKLNVFEGPLDLLLHLIDKNKIDIYDIPIVEITDQYMEYLHSMEKEDLGIMSEFLVMAATLLDIKCKMLLPKEGNEEGEEEDPRAELVQKLLEYKMYKYMSYELRDRLGDAAGVYYRKQDLPEEVLQYTPPSDPQELLRGLTLERMSAIYQALIRRQENKIDPIRSKFGTIRREPVSLEQKVGSVMAYARKNRRFSFRQLLERQADKLEVVVTFLAVLELMKMGKIHLTQEHLFDDMNIETLEPEGEQGELDLKELEVDMQQ